MANAKFVIYKDKGENYRWRLVAPKGQETAASGEHFASHYDASGPPSRSRSTPPPQKSSTTPRDAP